MADPNGCERCAVLAAEVERQKAHGKRMDDDRLAARDLLAVALRAAMLHRADPDVGDLLVEIEGACPSVLSDEFWQRDVDLEFAREVTSRRASPARRDSNG